VVSVHATDERQQVVNSPEPHFFIGVNAIAFSTLFIKEKQRCGKSERGCLKVQWAPFPCDDVGVMFSGIECGGEKVFGIALHHIAQGCLYVLIGEVHEAVAAEDKAYSGKVICEQVQLAEMEVLVVIKALILIDQRSDDICTMVGNSSEIHLFHPEEIATGDIQHRGDMKIAEDGR
jgi:hypothetical protein